MDGNTKVCARCGFANRPGMRICEYCGNNLSADPSDPVQTYKSEANLMGYLLRGEYDRKFLPLTFSLIIGMGVNLVGLSIFFVLIKPPASVFSLLTGIFFLLVSILGAWVVFQALRKIFLKDKRNIIVEILIGLLIILVIIGLVKFASEEFSQDGVIKTTTVTYPSVTHSASIPQNSPVISASPQVTSNTNSNVPQKLPDNWKSYQNNDLGFSFRYPANWTPKESLADSELSAKVGKIVAGNLTILVNNDGVGFEDARFFYQGQISNGKIILDQVDEQKDSETSSTVTVYLQTYQNNDYFILYTYNDATKDQDLAVFKKIISSFQFN